MKRTIYTSVAALCLALALSSCHDELLEMTPPSALTEVNAFNNAKDLDLAMLGVYNRLQVRKPNDYLILEMPSDNLYMSNNTAVAGANEADLLAFTPDNPQVANYWESSYNGIFRANAVLGNIDKPLNYANGQKDQLVGEAKFMRALFYFDLVRAFGGVPKVTATISKIEESRTIGRASESEIYDLIEEDLKEAITKLPLQANIAKGRASKAAAVALLAKVYVYQKDWNNAKTYLEQFLNDYPGYGLVNDFASLWKLETEDNRETIFSIRYVDGTNGHTLSTAFIPNSGAIGIVSRGNEMALPSWSLHKQYQEGDTRKAATIKEFWTPPSTPNNPPIWYPYINKYAVTHTYGSSGLDLPVIRFADVVLLYAETLYELGQPDQALAQLNKVRERAFGSAANNYTLADISSKEAFYDKLLLERQLEFAVENERWFDLVRTGRYMSLTREERGFNNNTQTALVVSLTPKEHLKYFPIPQRQIDQSAPGVLTQNPGY
ncbi:putative outer membrane starch-binding protein [Pontibacter mucosus]|uniref:Putative outer membrane starch-binding protein n=1 Tax=Pontibacter mucosus TaxID=1649266 RepID=A0A2T5YHS8_9BACT|nr:RagB/SusD family nutrient uptake outer membrane protein [Pontibacter mucosus]PTX18876.1 putative outer membrane starch-binding protein [Pontibacter mucosus]